MPLVATMSFSRGFSRKGRFRNNAEFDGHFLFHGTWHHMKNGVYLQDSSPEPWQEMPPYKPCLLQWRDKPRAGALNYDHQEVSFLLQFRGLRIVDRAGKRENFIIETGIGEAVMQFQGEAVPGRLIYRRMDLTDYNPYSHNIEAMRPRRFNQFFLFDGEEFYVLWCEQEGRRMPRLWYQPERMVGVTEKRKPLGEQEKTVGLFSENITMTWPRTEKEGNPQNVFREYPVAWQVSATLAPEEDRFGKKKEPEVVEIELSSRYGYYWFNRGLFFVTGRVAKTGKAVWGIGEVVRGH
jgi:hypothetical protein